MRKILDIVAKYQNDISDQIDLNKIEIKRLWTIYNEKELWNSYPKFDAQTGKKLPEKEITIDDLLLRHHDGIFLEDKIHDWSIKNGLLNYYSRVVEKNTPVKILIEYDEI